MLTLFGAGVLALVSAWQARRRPAIALLAAVLVSLIVPATVWFHYLIVFVPFIALAWPKARRLERASLLVGLGLTAAAAMVSPILIVAILLVIVPLFVILWRLPHVDGLAAAPSVFVADLR